MVLAVSNFSSVHHTDYKIGVPNRGIYTEVFSSDAKDFGGEGIANGKVTAKSGQMHGQKYHITLNLPPFSTTFFYKKKPAERKTKPVPKGKNNLTASRQKDSLRKSKSKRVSKQK